MSEIELLTSGERVAVCLAMEDDDEAPAADFKTVHRWAQRSDLRFGSPVLVRLLAVEAELVEARATIERVRALRDRWYVSTSQQDRWGAFAELDAALKPGEVAKLRASFAGELGAANGNIERVTDAGWDLESRLSELVSGWHQAQHGSSAIGSCLVQTCVDACAALERWLDVAGEYDDPGDFDDQVPGFEPLAGDRTADQLRKELQ